MDLGAGEHRLEWLQQEWLGGRSSGARWADRTAATCREPRGANALRLEPLDVRTQVPRLSPAAGHRLEPTLFHQIGNLAAPDVQLPGDVALREQRLRGPLAMVLLRCAQHAKFLALRLDEGGQKLNLGD